MPSEAAALAIFTASTSDQPRAISAHMAPVWHEPAERVCVAFVGYPSTWMTSPPGVRTHAPRDPARTTSGARSRGAEAVAQRLHRVVEPAADGHRQGIVHEHAKPVGERAGLLTVAGPDGPHQHQILQQVSLTMCSVLVGLSTML